MNLDKLKKSKLWSDPEFERQLFEEYVKRFGHQPPGRKFWCPQVPTKAQKVFIGVDSLEALYGGAAGGGKSSCLLMLALQYVNDPGYSAVLFRRTYTDLALSGALMDRASDWLSGSDARWLGQDKAWVFPSGARIQFGYLESEKDKYRYQSAEFQFIGFDELTQFSETQYLYMMTRLRRTKEIKAPLRVRSASNPGGEGHDWVYRRFVDPRTAEDRVFVPARLDDNPHLNSDEYRQALSLLDETTKRQLLHGEWVKDTSQLIYKLSDANIAKSNDELPRNLLRILAVDLGASAHDATTAFCIVGYARHRKEVWCLESWAESGATPSSIAKRIWEIEKKGPLSHIVMDAGALGVGYVNEMRSRHNLPVEPAKKTNKSGYRRLLNGDLTNHVIRIIDDTNHGLIEELNHLLWDAQGKDSMRGQADHLTDAFLYAWREAKHWLSQEEYTPEKGTREYDQWQNKKMADEEWNEAEKPWWDGR